MNDTTEYSRIQIAGGNKIDCTPPLVHAAPGARRAAPVPVAPLLEIALQNA
jgi:hypothetical protein